MSTTTVERNGITLPKVSLPFIENVIENAGDVVTLDGTMHTDFVNQRQGFELNWSVMTLDEYEVLRGIYDSQYTTGDYPEFTCDYYDAEDVACRMYINDRDVRVMGCQVYDVKVKLIRSGSINETS